MSDDIKIQFLTGLKHLAPHEYFTREVASLSRDVRIAMHAARIGKVHQDNNLPPGVLECRVGTKVLSRLRFE